ncbi:ribosome biogenesis GTPase Der [Thalassobaculum sp. OXR-137]|uniref:ribosome biogenesis GTPase Der n=1 Tax=Thalassobaculum sp. OXR-137 TaxID=3100173 RepID=UPI002AC8EE57|nr:ribosome biogenesis GTPase Der [Thalassobaculum sp. OXR-137]WPZ33682.1 ribosome biogenesis GTPase Der [Thalassobaculum sp. OXR-137]
MALKVAIIGRPNVGKSTLFNRLTGTKHALVDDTPGVTRDRREGDARIADLSFRIVDTAGLEDAHDDSLEGRMRRQTEAAVQQADLVFMMIDARAGVTPLDAHFADWLRRVKVPVTVLANKCEGRGGIAGLSEAYKLGLGDPVPISAEHGEGMGELYDLIRARIEADPVLAAELAAQYDDDPFPEEILDGVDLDEADLEEDAILKDRGPKGPLKLAIVGRPNVGKSTLINRLLGEDRLLTGPEAGITRDSIEIPWSYKGRDIHLIDTAGLRRKARVVEKLERMSTTDSMRAVRFAQVVMLVLDGEQMLEKQDLAIARTVLDQGRALIIAVNKWDAVADKNAAGQRLRDRLDTSLAQVRGIPWIAVSALRGSNLDKLLDAVFDIYDVWNTRVPTSRLNRWLERMVDQHPPPLSKGRRLRLRYMTQVKARPPTFAAFVSQADELPESYVRYLIGGLRDEFGLVGVPIRVNLRKRRNPYVDD